MPALHQRGSDSIAEFEAAAAQRCAEANLAVAARATTARPYPIGAGQLGQEIVNRATEIYLIWRETLRYRASRPTTAEHRAVRRIAEWFEAGYAKMV